MIDMHLQSTYLANEMLKPCGNVGSRVESDFFKGSCNIGSRIEKIFLPSPLVTLCEAGTSSDLARIKSIF